MDHQLWIERQIEGVLILADEAILKRPFTVKLVGDALALVCDAHKYLCDNVRRHLQRYSRDYAITEANSLSDAVSSEKYCDLRAPSVDGPVVRGRAYWRHFARNARHLCARNGLTEASI